MTTGIELAGLILAIYPLIISAMEHYDDVCTPINDWIKFRAGFNSFLNELVRQQIFFRQHIEELLSCVVDSEYHMACMLANMKDPQWTDPKLEVGLKNRLSGDHEYESYTATVTSILGVLEKINKRLNIPASSTEEHWSQTKGKGFLRLEFELKSILYLLDKKRRVRLMNQLGKYNNELKLLLSNSDRLEPMRRKRKAAIPSIFEEFRRTSFKPSQRHLQVLTMKARVWSSSHTLVGPDDDWFVAEVKAAGIEAADKEDSDTLTRKSVSTTGSAAIMSATPLVLDRTNRKVSFHEGSVRKLSLSSIPSIPKDANEISDLCIALKQHDKTQQFLGYLRGENDQCHMIYHSPNSEVIPSQIDRIVTLGALYRGHQESIAHVSTNPNFRRQERLQVALIMAKALLQLYKSPWLGDSWDKEDIYLFQEHDGKVKATLPFLVSNHSSTNVVSKLPSPNPKSSSSMNRKNAKEFLLALGILVLELWFNKTIESCSFRESFLSPNGSENEYTNFNTAQKWQEQALEEGGIDLDNLTYRCIYCYFGAAKQDLNDGELRKSVYHEVVLPLERILARYEMSSVEAAI